jgi:hypothetical protein
VARDRSHDQLREGGADHDRRFVAGEDCDHNHWVHGEMGGSGSGSGSGDPDLEQKGLNQALSSDTSLRFDLGLDSAQSETGQGLGWSLLGPCAMHVLTHGSTHDGLQKPGLLQWARCENHVGLGVCELLAW